MNNIRLFTALGTIKNDIWEEYENSLIEGKNSKILISHKEYSSMKKKARNSIIAAVIVFVLSVSFIVTALVTNIF